jgi:hypothetical protein
MNSRGGSARCKLASTVSAIVVVVLLCFASLAKAQSASHLGLKPALAPLAYFTGDWECSGKFDSSGKTIEAHQHFAPDLDGAWILFRHDDKPPFSYHALAEWGWNETSKEFVMTVEDSFAGVRVFHSGGWEGTQLRWDGDALGGASSASQRFTFERLDDRHFQVSYFTLKNNAWSRMDASTCSKQ